MRNTPVKVKIINIHVDRPPSPHVYVTRVPRFGTRTGCKCKARLFKMTIERDRRSRGYGLRNHDFQKRDSVIHLNRFMSEP